MTISLNQGGRSTEVFRCPQRDLFSKYKWPAGPKIMMAMEEVKEMIDEEDPGSPSAATDK